MDAPILLPDQYTDADALRTVIGHLEQRRLFITAGAYKVRLAQLAQGGTVHANTSPDVAAAEAALRADERDDLLEQIHEAEDSQKWAAAAALKVKLGRLSSSKVGTLNLRLGQLGPPSQKP
jgi:hypothetical protein